MEAVDTEKLTDDCKSANLENQEKSTDSADNGYRSPCEKTYLARLALFQKNYLRLVIFAGIGVFAGIATAVHLNIWAGIALSVISAAAYFLLSTEECHRLLGLIYKNSDGKIIITRALPIYENTVIIPSRLIFADVKDISTGAVVWEGLNENEERVIYIPLSVTYIADRAFGEDVSKLTVRFQGSPETWESLVKPCCLENAQVVFNTPYPTLPKKARKKKRTNGKERTK